MSVNCPAGRSPFRVARSPQARPLRLLLRADRERLRFRRCSRFERLPNASGPLQLRLHTFRPRSYPSQRSPPCCVLSSLALIVLVTILLSWFVVSLSWFPPWPRPLLSLGTVPGFPTPFPRVVGGRGRENRNRFGRPSFPTTLAGPGKEYTDLRPPIAAHRRQISCTYPVESRKQDWEQETEQEIPLRIIFHVEKSDRPLRVFTRVKRTSAPVVVTMPNPTAARRHAALGPADPTPRGAAGASARSRGAGRRGITTWFGPEEGNRRRLAIPARRGLDSVRGRGRRTWLPSASPQSRSSPAQPAPNP